MHAPGDAAVIVTLHVKAGCDAKFKTLISEIGAEFAASADTNLFQLFRSREAGAYRIITTYPDRPALERYATSAHFRAATARLAPLLSKPLDIEQLDPPAAR